MKELKSIYAEQQPSGRPARRPRWLSDDATQPLSCSSIIGAPGAASLGYRNKCEFSIGLDRDGVARVGFMLGLYREGITTVCGAQQCVHVSSNMKAIAAQLESFVQESDLAVYDRVTHEGNWRLLVVRAQQSGDAIVVLQLHPQHMDDQRRTELRDKLHANFIAPMCADGKFRSLSVFLQFYDGVNNGFFEDAPLELIHGEGTALEDIHLVDSSSQLSTSLQFRISPFSFFQTSTKACECLFSTISSWVSESSLDDSRPKVILDLCCGTGTIGIALSKLGSVRRVIGIELCPSAVEDAKFNSDLNEVVNVEYICAKVEDALQKNLKELNACNEKCDVIAILDPPRSGLHRTVISALRDCHLITRLIYVSCNPSAAMNNWIE